MAERDLVIGVDASTTAVKAVVWDARGNCQAASRVTLPVEKPRPTWHEQPASAWWEATALALRQAAAEVDSRRLAALCIAPQRETFVLTDEQGNPLHPALLWMDERSSELLPEIDRVYGKDRIHRETGKPLSANLTLGKLFWLNRYLPELNGSRTRVCDVHAFLANRLCGRFVTSWGCADPTGLFDMRRNDWNEALIQAAGFDAAQFPAALPPGEIVGWLHVNSASECGLPQALPLVAGLGDGQAAGLGVGAVQPGEVYLNLGTAVVSGTFSQRYLVDPAFRTMYGGIPGSYSLETVLPGGAYTISWFVEQFSGIDPSSLAPGLSAEEILESEASRIAPGAEGLTLVPYWNSAMNPYWNASASGIMVGWRGIHGRGHFYRAILEGIAYELRLHLQGVEKALNQRLEKFIAVGGGSRSPLWRQIIADITQRPVYTAEASEASALGAGILAASAAGLHPSIAAAARAMTRRAPGCDRPDPGRSQRYQQLYQDVYRGLYPALQPYLDRLANLAARGSSTREYN